MQVGLAMASDLNLTRVSLQSTQPVASGEQDCCSHLFLSVSDFVSVVSRHKGVGMQLLERLPDVAEYVWRASPLYHQATQAMDAVRQHAFTMYLDSLWRDVMLRMGVAGGSILAEAGAPNQNATIANLSAAYASEEVKRFIRQHQKQVALFYAYSNDVAHSRPLQNPEAIPKPRRDGSPVQEHGGSDQNRGEGSQRRRLLQSSTQSNDYGSPVDMYSSLVASSQGFTNIALGRFESSGNGQRLITQTWLEGPFAWPPKVGALEEAGSCKAAETVFSSALEVFQVSVFCL